MPLFAPTPPARHVLVNPYIVNAVDLLNRQSENNIILYPSKLFKQLRKISSTLPFSYKLTTID